MDSRKVATASVFGVIIAIVKGPLLPPPSGDLLVVVEAMLLGLSFIILGIGGATYTAAVAGLLINFVEPGFYFYPFVLALLYGLLVDGVSSVLKVKTAESVSSKRLAVSLTIATAVVGPVAYYATVYLTPILPSDPSIYATIIIVGVVSGAVGGILATRIWDRNLKARFKSVQPPVG
ncbi:MAG: hypothetical protein ACHQYR_03100 [Candidatus Gagatemarchaeaceae archaeon]